MRCKFLVLTFSHAHYSRAYFLLLFDSLVPLQSVWWWCAFCMCFFVCHHLADALLPYFGVIIINIIIIFNKSISLLVMVLFFCIIFYISMKNIHLLHSWLWIKWNTRPKLITFTFNTMCELMRYDNIWNIKNTLKTCAILW